MSDQNNGGSTDYYKLPDNAKDLQDLIEFKSMSFARGNILKVAYAVGERSHSDAGRDWNKVIWFAQRELELLNSIDKKNIATMTLDELKTWTLKDVLKSYEPLLDVIDAAEKSIQNLNATENQKVENLKDKQCKFKVGDKVLVDNIFGIWEILFLYDDAREAVVNNCKTNDVRRFHVNNLSLAKKQ